MIYNFVDYPFKFIWQDFEIILYMQPTKDIGL